MDYICKKDKELCYSEPKSNLTEFQSQVYKQVLDLLYPISVYGFIAGGVCRTFLTNIETSETIDDIDIYCKEERYFKEVVNALIKNDYKLIESKNSGLYFRKEGCILPVNVIIPKVVNGNNLFGKPEEVIKSFDFYSNAIFIHHTEKNDTVYSEYEKQTYTEKSNSGFILIGLRNGFYDIGHRRLTVLNDKQSKYVTFRRIIKYITKKKFHMNPTASIDFINSIQNSAIGAKEEFEMYQECYLGDFEE